MKENQPEHIEGDEGLIEARLRAGRANASMYLIGIAVLVWLVALAGWDDLAFAWPWLGDKRPGIYGMLLAASVFCGITVFLCIASRRFDGALTRTIICPNCSYTIANSWDRDLQAIVRCPECGRQFWMWSYIVAAAPSVRVFTWSRFLRRRSVRFAMCAGLLGFLVGGLTAALMHPEFDSSAGFNTLGMTVAGASAGFAIAIAIADIALLRETSRSTPGGVCPSGHDGLGAVVSQRRTLWWCETCSDGWWQPTSRDLLLHAAAAEIARERGEPARGASTEEPE